MISRMQGFWVGCAVLCVFALMTMDFRTPLVGICGLGILAVSVAPFYFWLSGDVGGVPVYPVYSLTYIITHAIPMIQGLDPVYRFRDGQPIEAGLTTIYFLALATFCWYLIGSRSAHPPATFLCFPSGMNGGLLAALGVCGAILLSMKRSWLPLQGAYASTLTQCLIAFTTLSTALLAYSWGKKDLTLEQVWTFVLLLMFCILVHFTSLLLFMGVMLLGTAVIAFTIGRERLPLLTIMALILVFGFLQLGKSEMRRHVWSEERISGEVKNVPQLFTQWVLFSQAGAVNMAEGNSDKNKNQSLAERLSLIHLLMLVNEQSEAGTPPLKGETYWIVPDAVLPRLVNNEKIATHEGTYILCIHYGLQTREATRKTTIGWGLLAEAYANFSLFGVTYLAIILGAGLGYLGRWSAGLPFLSFRTLFAFTVLVQFLHTEACASLLTASLLQTTVILLVMAQLTGAVTANESEPHEVADNWRAGFPQ
jgi:hypothetical protein